MSVLRSTAQRRCSYCALDYETYAVFDSSVSRACSDCPQRDNGTARILVYHTQDAVRHTPHRYCGIHTIRQVARAVALFYCSIVSWFTCSQVPFFTHPPFSTTLNTGPPAILLPNIFRHPHSVACHRHYSTYKLCTRSCAHSQFFLLPRTPHTVCYAVSSSTLYSDSLRSPSTSHRTPDPKASEILRFYALSQHETSNTRDQRS